MKRTVIIVILILTLGLILTGYLMYTHEMPDQVAKSPDYTTTASELLNDFETDLASASSKYINKIIQFNGTLKAVDTSGSLTIGTMDTGGEIIMAIDPRYKKFLAQTTLGESVVVQGLCSSYNRNEVVAEDLLSGLGATLHFRSGGIKQ